MAILTACSGAWMEGNMDSVAGSGCRFQPVTALRIPVAAYRWRIWHGHNGGQTASKIVYVTYIKHDETNNDK